MSEPLNGIVYVFNTISGPGDTGITAYDPAAGTLNYLGNFPDDWSLGGFFVENNTLYAVALQRPDGHVQHMCACQCEYRQFQPGGSVRTRRPLHLLLKTPGGGH
jgi:hypothetical protein